MRPDPRKTWSEAAHLRYRGGVMTEKSFATPFLRFAASLGAAAVLFGCPPKEGQSPGAEHPATNTTPQPSSMPAGAPASQPASQPSASNARGTSPDTRDQVDPDGIVRRGRALSSLATLTVDECQSKADSLDAQVVKVKGTVGSVCQAKGCWMVLKGEGDEHIRITAEDYGFFVPKTASGWTATVEGKLGAEILDVETAQHLEDESGRKPPRKITEPVKELSITATGLELVPPKTS
ncbi:MAG: DUF4920 domain-containing protein [Deltaproteobacteria bacterium]|nr:DUF4920 domain-containing protein [Deltaproteobacteria bacterium]